MFKKYCYLTTTDIDTLNSLPRWCQITVFVEYYFDTPNYDLCLNDLLLVRYGIEDNWVLLHEEGEMRGLDNIKLYLKEKFPLLDVYENCQYYHTGFWVSRYIWNDSTRPLVDTPVMDKVHHTDQVYLDICEFNSKDFYVVVSYDSEAILPDDLKLSLDSLIASGVSTNSNAKLLECTMRNYNEQPLPGYVRQRLLRDTCIPRDSLRESLWTDVKSKWDPSKFKDSNPFSEPDTEYTHKENLSEYPIKWKPDHLVELHRKHQENEEIVHKATPEHIRLKYPDHYILYVVDLKTNTEHVEVYKYWSHANAKKAKYNHEQYKTRIGYNHSLIENNHIMKIG